MPTKTTRTGNEATTYDGMYESTFTLSGGRTGTFGGSIYPDDMTVKGRVVDGTYPLHIGIKGWASQADRHRFGGSNRGSDGCLTLQPSDWSRFIQLFLTAFPNIDDWHTIGNNTGKEIGDLVIQS